MGIMRVVSIALLLAGAAGAAIADDSDLSRAADLYKTAEAEMTAGDYEQAARDYGGAYEASKDPALLFKIGSANEKAGNCKVALVYFRRYLDDGKPSAAYEKLTEERIAACMAALPTPEPETPPAETQPAPAPLPKLMPPKGHGNDAAWLMVGGTIALLTTGAVLAYSATSSEDDVRDLYIGLQGTPPAFDAATQLRYQQLLDEGHRYQHLAWAAFGLAGATAVASAYLFWRHSDAEIVAPAVTPHGAGISATLRF